MWNINFNIEIKESKILILLTRKMYKHEKIIICKYEKKIKYNKIFQVH